MKILKTYKIFESDDIAAKIQGEMLIDAIERGQDTFANNLIDSGANVNVSNLAGQYAIVSAAHFGLSKLVRKLVKASADINVQDSAGCTAIYSAAAMGYVNIVKYLINIGADLTIKTNRDRDFFDAASSIDKVCKFLNSIETQKMLFEKDPSIYHAYIRNKPCLFINPSIKKEFPHLGTADDLNLL